jgi:hypothetical protein
MHQRATGALHGNLIFRNRRPAHLAVAGAGAGALLTRATLLLG